MKVTRVSDLSSTVIVLPRNVPQTHDTTYERTALVDPLAWGVPDLVNIVRSLTCLTGAVTVPGLDEWVLLPDKVTSDPNLRMNPFPHLSVLHFTGCEMTWKDLTLGLTWASTCMRRDVSSKAC